MNSIFINIWKILIRFYSNYHDYFEFYNKIICIILENLYDIYIKELEPLWSVQLGGVKLFRVKVDLIWRLNINNNAGAFVLLLMREEIYVT